MTDRSDVVRSAREAGLPDLRLAGFAVAMWLAALACLYLSARSGLLLTGAALAAAVAAAKLRASTKPVRWIAVAVLLGAAAGAAVTAARVSVREAGPLAALVRAGASVQIELIVRDDPRALRGSPGLPPTYLVAVDLTAVRGDGPAMSLSARTLVLAADPGWRGLLPGQRATARGRLLEPRGGDLRAAVVSVKEAPTLVGRPPWAQRAAGVLRTGLQRACEPLPDDAGGLLPGLVVGDTSRLDPVLENDFRTTGMTHLTAVSGSNVGQTLLRTLADDAYLEGSTGCQPEFRVETLDVSRLSVSRLGRG